ncbi:mitochondrial carrier protein, putative [Plasmodium chabaudi chabaudi]|uniref:Mitochondrial carrier protein, putative n=1 Tax=Plasmodium chabaudi chabaudi TaxID=31271 RepID=A0A1D3LAK0_PLACU|nr:mitochondrial carrier protein, putative [Plasmodium chabaudi chabaudi]
MEKKQQDVIEKNELDSNNMTQTLYGSIIASTTTRIILYPFDTIKVNKQVSIIKNNLNSGSNITHHHSCSKNILSTRQGPFLFSFISRFGFKGLYTGFIFSSLTTIPATSFYFCCYEYLKSLKFNKSINEENKNNLESSRVSNFLSYCFLAIFSEAISCTIFVPIDTIKERLQAQKYLGLKEYTSSYHLIKNFIHKEGIPRLYRGYTSTCLTYGLFCGSFFFLQNTGNDLMQSLKIEPSNFNKFSLNLASSFISGIITSPLEIVRIRLQLQEKDKTSFYYKNSFDGIKSLWREGQGGFLNLFKGNLYRCFLVCLSMSMNVTLIDMYKNFALAK